MCASMYIYLSKKISIPHGRRLHTLGWNGNHGWVAAGAEEALLKVLKMETDASGGGQLSMNQTLGGHSGAVTCVAWNEQHKKLTSSDEKGLIIVWSLHKGSWVEEMINDRKTSVVADMRWAPDGKRICIAYQDGLVIVGSVDGNRIWGSEVGFQLKLVCWDPDARLIVFVTPKGEVHVFDQTGNAIGRIPLVLEGIPGPPDVYSIDWYTPANRAGVPPPPPPAGGGAGGGGGAAGALADRQPTLCIALTAGRIQLMRSETDDRPVVVDTGLQRPLARWSRSQPVLAVSGTQVVTTAKAEQVSLSVVQFYNPSGQHLRTLKVPGASIGGIAWEGTGLRMTIAVDSFVYFANIRPEYRMCHFQSTVVLITDPVPGADRQPGDQAVVFWDTSTRETSVLHLRGARHVKSAPGAHCCVVASMSEATDSAGGRWTLMVCNAVGGILATRQVHFEPIYLAMSDDHVIAASMDTVYVWHFAGTLQQQTVPGASAAVAGPTPPGGGSRPSTAAVQAALHRQGGKETVFHVDDGPPALGSGGVSGGGRGRKGASDEVTTKDKIACVAGGKGCLYLARQSGKLIKFTTAGLQVGVEGEFVTSAYPIALYPNCNDTRLAWLDRGNRLYLFDFEGNPEGDAFDAVMGPAPMQFERKDTWDVRWNEDTPHDFCVMEKTRLTMFRGLEPEAPIVTHSYLLSFKDMQVKTFDIDSVLLGGVHPGIAPPDPRHLYSFDTAPLRACVDLIRTAGLREAYDYACDVMAFNARTGGGGAAGGARIASPSPSGKDGKRAVVEPPTKLWRTVAEAALEQLDLELAKTCFVRCRDFHGVQLCGRLHILQGERRKQQAEVAVYFGRHDAAEAIYRESDRWDLALGMRVRLGDWKGVEKLLPAAGPAGGAAGGRGGGGVGMGGEDALKARVWAELGGFHLDEHRWLEASKYLWRAGNLPKLAECLYAMEDYEGLVELMGGIGDLNGQPADLTDAEKSLLSELAGMFASVGLCAEATQAHLRRGDVKAAIDTAVVLYQWDTAVELAEQHEFPQIEALLAKYAGAMLESGKTGEAVRLLMKAKKHPEAAKVLASMGDELVSKGRDPVRAKKLYVLAALEVEKFKKKTLAVDAASVTASGQTATLGGMTLAGAGGMTAQKTLDSMMTYDKATTGSANAAISAAWRGAEAMHLWLLSHRQMYEGAPEMAMRTAMNLWEYEDILGTIRINSLIALTSFHAGYFKQCSKAFVRLENSSTKDCIMAERVAAGGALSAGFEEGAQGEPLAEGTREGFRQLAMAIFTEQAPVDSKASTTELKQDEEDEVHRTKMSGQGKHFGKSLCMATGRRLHERSERIKCQGCKHYSLLSAVDTTQLIHCPLCHSVLARTPDLADDIGRLGLGGAGAGGAKPKPGFRGAASKVVAGQRVAGEGRFFGSTMDLLS